MLKRGRLEVVFRSMFVACQHTYFPGVRNYNTPDNGLHCDFQSLTRSLDNAYLASVGHPTEHSWRVQPNLTHSGPSG